MTRVGVSGAAGRLGRLVSAAVASAPDLESGWLYAPGHDGEEIAGIPCIGDPGALDRVDVVVEVTRPDVVMENLDRWRSMGAHAVVGTSGFDDERMALLSERWGDGPPNCLVVPNFSVAATLMMRFAAEARPYFEGAEIIEMHHATKVDAPSGTAVATESAMGGDVPIHSVRLAGMVAHQEVIFGAPGEFLTIRHDTTDRSSFMPGVLAAVRGVADLSGVVRGLDAVL